MKEIKADEFYENVILGDGVSAVIFSAPWCSFCSAIIKVAQAVEEISGAQIYKVDIDKEKSLSAKYTVSSVPTTLVFYKGRLTERKAGLLKKSELMALIKSAKKRETAKK